MSPAGGDREHLVSTAFTRLADTLVDEYDVIDLLDRLVGYSVDLLAVDAAGIVLGDVRGTLRVVAASNDDAQLMELLQLQNDEGPCLECFRTATAVSVPDLADVVDRWPRFTAAVDARRVFRSVHALPLRLRQESIGALNLFNGRPGPMSEADLSLGQALADVATIGILQERAIRRGEVVNQQLQTALNNRVVIEQAKGVLAERGDDRHGRRVRPAARLLAQDQPAAQPRGAPDRRARARSGRGARTLRLRGSGRAEFRPVPVTSR